METSPTQRYITEICREIEEILLAKNLAYGDSAINPVRCFSKASTLEQINVRLDDKLSRLMRGTAAGEDAELDLMGYLVLKRVAIRMQSANERVIKLEAQTPTPEQVALAQGARAVRDATSCRTTETSTVSTSHGSWDARSPLGVHREEGDSMDT